MTLELVHFSEAKPFQAAVLPFALQAEAENNLLIGLAAQLDANLLSPSAPPLMFIARAAGEVVGAGFRTAPFPLVLSTMSPDTARRIAAQLRARSESLSGVVGPREVAHAFAQAWVQSMPAPRLHCSMRVYRLDRVNAAPSVPGRMVTASVAQTPLILTWRSAFAAETHERTPADPEIVRRRVAAGEIVLWIDGEPVATAGFGGPTPNGMRVNIVYTPPEQRRRGYATALVAALSQRLLDGGRKFCFLFTDAENPTSNGIYQKIGYQPVCDFADFRFD